MDSNEPEPPHPHPHNHQPEKNVPVASYPLTKTIPTTMIQLTTTQFPILNMDSNPSPLFEPFNNNIGPSTLKSSGSIKKKRGRPRKYFLDDNITLTLGSGPIHDATITYPSHSVVKKSTRGRGRPRGSFKKKHDVEVLGMLNLFLFYYLNFDFLIYLILIFILVVNFSGVIDTSFSPHLISVNYGEVCYQTYN